MSIREAWYHEASSVMAIDEAWKPFEVVMHKASHEVSADQKDTLAGS